MLSVHVTGEFFSYSFIFFNLRFPKTYGFLSYSSVCNELTIMNRCHERLYWTIYHRATNSVIAVSKQNMCRPHTVKCSHKRIILFLLMSKPFTTTFDMVIVLHKIVLITQYVSLTSKKGCNLVFF